MIPLIWHPAARQEVVDLAERFAQIDKKLLVRFNASVSRYLRLIQENPRTFHERRHEFRRANLSPKFGEYYLAYILWNEHIVIVALGHAKRRPFYFSKRLGDAKRLTQ